MVRKEIDLTEEECKGLAVLTERTGRNESELIRQAVDQLLKKNSTEERRAAMRAAFGMWKDRTDLPDFEALRAESDRSFPRE